MGESRQLSRFLQWTGEALLCAGRFDEADVALCRALRLGEKLGDKESEMFALWDLVWLCSVRPDDRPNDYIGKSGRKVLEYADELDDYYHKMTSRYTLSADCLERGYLTEADAWAQELLAFGRESGYGPATSVGSMFRALCFALRGEFDQARELSEESIKRAVSEIERALGMGVKGLVLTLQGEFDEACELLAYVRTVAHEETFQVLLTTVEIPYGAALAFSGRVEEGVGILLDAVDMFSRWRNSRMVAWANLVLGQIYLHGSMAHAGARAEEAMSGFDDARRHLEQAVRIGRAAGTDGHVVEALLNLGLLAKTCARPDDARTHLEEAFGLVGRLGWPDLTQRVESALADL